MELRPRRAVATDLNAILKLLDAAGLPHDGVESALNGCYVCEDNGRYLGVAGLEIYSGDGLLRSVAVAPAHRRRGVATALCVHVLDHARSAGCGAVYLLTLDAPGYFEKLGFETIGRDQAPPGIRASEEFAHLCPDSAVLMRRYLAP